MKDTDRVPDHAWYIMTLPPFVFCDFSVEMWLWGRTGSDVHTLFGGLLLSQLRAGLLFDTYALRGQESSSGQRRNCCHRHLMWQLHARVMLCLVWLSLLLLGKQSCPGGYEEFHLSPAKLGVALLGLDFKRVGPPQP